MIKLITPKELLKHACPKCDQRTPIKGNFCTQCCHLINPEGYFKFLLTAKKP